MRPEVTVIVVTYNRHQLLRQTLRSVLDQRDVEIEVLLVDNGSTPPVAGVIDDLVDDRVRVVRMESNGLPVDARNAALAEARGSWIAYVDDDDLWAPDKLRDQVDACRQQDATWGYTGIVDIDEQGRIIRGEPPMSAAAVAVALPYRCEVPGGQSGLMATAEALRGLGGPDRTYKFVSDWDLYLRLLREHGAPSCLSRPMVAYRLHHGQLSNSPDAFLGEVAIMNDRHADLRRDDDIGQSELDESFILRGVAEGALRSGQRLTAAKGFVSAAVAGDRRSWLLLLTVLLPDRWQRSLRMRRADAAWVQEAEDWIEPLRISA